MVMIPRLMVFILFQILSFLRTLKRFKWFGDWLKMVSFTTSLEGWFGYLNWRSNCQVEAWILQAFFPRALFCSTHFLIDMGNCGGVRFPDSKLTERKRKSAYFTNDFFRPHFPYISIASFPRFKVHSWSVPKIYFRPRSYIQRWFVFNSIAFSEERRREIYAARLETSNILESYSSTDKVHPSHQA